jgi:ABC-type glycerol-3-phosphate transport system substrate-binding protein
MGKIMTLFLFLFALAYVVFPDPVQQYQPENPIKELHFWGLYDVPEVYSPIMDEFTRKYPQVKVTYKQFSNYEEYEMLLQRQLQQGKGPDIFLFNDENRAEYASSINPTNLADVESYPSYVKEKLTTNRLLFGVPLWVDSLVLYYNKKHYPDGIKSQWYEFAEETKNINIGGIAMGRLDNLRSGWSILKALFLQKEVKVSGLPENNLFDVLEFYTRFAYPIDPYFNWNDTLNKDYPDEEIDSFAREKVASIAGYSSLYNFLLTKTEQLAAGNTNGIKKEEIGVAPFPQFDVQNPKYLAKYFFLGVSIHSKHPNEAWDFIRMLTNEKNAAYYSQVTGRTPGRFLPATSTDSELLKVQKQQLPNVYPFYVSLPAQQKIEEVVTKGLKDKRLLREILQVQL